MSNSVILKNEEYRCIEDGQDKCDTPKIVIIHKNA